MQYWILSNIEIRPTIQGQKYAKRRILGERAQMSRLRGKRDDNLASDRDWLALCNCLLEVHRAATHENVRYQVIRYLASEIPFQSAAFFVAGSNRRAHEGCFIAQPAGADLSISVFEELVHAAAQDPAADSSVVSVELDADMPLAKRYGEQALVCSFAGEQGPIAQLVLCRTREQVGFSEHDKLLLTVLEPHVSSRLKSLEAQSGVSSIQAELLIDEYHLTPREVEVMSCVAYGMTTPEIAVKLSASAATVKKHLERIYRKVGVNNRMSLMKLALQYMA